MKIKNQNKGFSLLELVVCMVIIAVLAVVLVPNFINLQHESKAKKDVTKFESICSAFEAALVQPEVKNEVEKLGGGSNLVVVAKIDTDGKINFGDSDLIGLISKKLKDSELWLNIYQTIGMSYETDSRELAGKYVVFYLRPKTTVSPSSCEYMVAESKPLIQKCTLMIGTHADKESADALVRKLSRDGFSARVECDGNQYLVYVGLFINTQDAKTVERELTDSGYASAIILLE
jgi:prepilin-type N-terminal cleavage/methylation domain-containing protein